MNKRSEGQKTGNPKEDGLDLLMTTIFKKALPIWQRYDGSVPPEALHQLDLAGDWPLGLAAAAMERLSRDPELREYLTSLEWRIEYE